MTTATNPWSWWRAALAGNPTPIDPNTPAQGFYETRSKNRQTGVETRGIIAYWYAADGTLRCLAGGAMLDEHRAIERWPFASRRPISRETYDTVRAGKDWPDEHPAAAADRSNAAPEDDSFEGVRDRIEDLAREAEKIIAAGAATTKVAADRAADLADRLLAREKLADVRRREEMAPHEAKAKEADAAWRPLRDKAADAKARLKKLVVTPFLLAAQAAAKQAGAEAIRAGRPAPATPARAVGTSGVSLRSTTTAVIEDYDKALAYFAGNEQVRELVQKLANASARSGTCPDGCRIHTAQAAA